MEHIVTVQQVPMSLVREVVRNLHEELYPYPLQTDDVSDNHTTVHMVFDEDF